MLENNRDCKTESNDEGGKIKKKGAGFKITIQSGKKKRKEKKSLREAGN